MTELTEDSAYNYSIMILQGGKINAKDRKFLINAIKLYEDRLAARDAEIEKLKKKLAKVCSTGQNLLIRDKKYQDTWWHQEFTQTIEDVERSK